MSVIADLFLELFARSLMYERALAFVERAASERVTLRDVLARILLLRLQIRIKNEVMQRFPLFLTLFLLSSACVSEADEADQLFTDFAFCEQEKRAPDQCQEEAAALADLLHGDDDNIRLRKNEASATANCFGTSKTCNGWACAAQDMLGCACFDASNNVTQTKWCWEP